MTGAAIKTLADALVNDTMSDTFFIGAVNTAKDSLEGERAWEHLKKLNSSNTVSTGATSTTAYTLPSDLIDPLRLTIGSDTSALSLVSYGDSRMLRDTSGIFWIDWANSYIYLGGTQGAGGTLYILYKRSTDDIASGTSPAWPAALGNTIGRFLAYEVAKQWFAQDASEREFNWSPEMAAEANHMKQQLISWDERLKAKAANNTPADMTFAAQL
jgi:hypothetical protein